jgi:hypothetical protein
MKKECNMIASIRQISAMAPGGAVGEKCYKTEETGKSQME